MRRSILITVKTLVEECVKERLGLGGEDLETREEEVEVTSINTS